MENLRLTQFSPGAGCGCKISPADLKSILKTTIGLRPDENLLVGNESSDDAAVYDLGDGRAIISTTDFFTPVVDDPADFGRIAATNAISDVYAMGGRPFLALAILGWPLSGLSGEMAAKVINGAKEVCNSLGVSLAGGHSIDIQVPVFGLSVNGIVDKKYLTRNNKATGRCCIFLTKPLGIGILTTAIKKDIIRVEHLEKVVKLMCKPNSAGVEIARLKGLKAMTDVTGFGLLGHLLEICEGSGLNAVLNYKNIPVMEEAMSYIQQKSVPGGTARNWKSYGQCISNISEDQKTILCDPQTSGGLLLAVEEEDKPVLKELQSQLGFELYEIGYFTPCDDEQAVRILVN